MYNCPFMVFFKHNSKTLQITHMRIRTLLFVWLGCHVSGLFAQPDAKAVLRYPALSPDGATLAFCYQGDIWTVPSSGGKAARLTVHEAYESHPQWSPDGQSIAFQGNRFGNNDIYVMSASGGTPRRLTHFSVNDENPKWDPAGRIVFNSRRYYASVERSPEMMTVSAEGGTPYRRSDGLGNAPCLSPDGRWLAFEYGSCPANREAYKGPAQRDIWLQDTQTGDLHRLTTFEGQDVQPIWAGPSALYFLSARSGRYNLYRQPIQNGRANGEPVALTRFTDEGIRYFSVSADGAHIVFEKGADLRYLSATSTDESKLLNIDVKSDERFDPYKTQVLSDKATDFSLSPNGKYIAFTVRGEIFITQANKEKRYCVPVSKNAFRDQSPLWLSDSTLLFLSDRNGNKDLYLVKSADESTSDLFRALRLDIQPLTATPEQESQLVLSPDRKRIAFVKDKGRLVVADIDDKGKMTNQQTLLNSWSTPEGVAWSPDGNWLAYAQDDLDFNKEIYIHAADNKSNPVNVSLHPRVDESPVWSADGSKLAFLSKRNNDNADVWFVWLKKADWEKTKRDWEDKEDEPTVKKDTSASKPVVIDFEEIHKRLVQVSSLPGNEASAMISKDGHTFYFSTNRGDRQMQAGKRSLMSIKWDGSDLTTILDDKALSILQWDKDLKYMVALDENGKLAKIEPGIKKAENIPFEAKMVINYAEERKQVFEETWRELNAGFYDPQFHGQDWQALRKQYEPLALAASTTQDFQFFVNEMLGQLNASHMGFTSPNPEEPQVEKTGWLGIEVTPVNQGVKVDRVVPDSPADRNDSKLYPGDIISAVNAVPISANINFYSLLNGSINERTLLEVQNAKGQRRDVVIRPAESLGDQLYDEWVTERRKLVDKWSAGKLGYIHIRGMNWPSFERFERELTASGQGKEGLLIDVRYNGGGWTTDMLMTVLNVQQHSYTIPRGAARDLDKENKQFNGNYPFGERLPFPALTKPSVALCNQDSYSNAEIFSHAYKHLEIGKLIGTPTFGAVISTGGFNLMDGSFVRMPFRAWFVKATGRNMENGPAIPDFIVENKADYRAEEADLQLKKAVDVLLEQLNNVKD